MVSRAMCAGALSCWKWRIRQKSDEWQATTVEKAERYDSKQGQSWLQHQQTLTMWHPTLTRRLDLRFNGIFAPELANNWNITVSQSSAAMSLRCSGICNNHFVAKFVLSLAVKEFRKSINISWSYQHEYGVLLIWLAVYKNSPVIRSFFGQGRKILVESWKLHNTIL